MASVRSKITQTIGILIVITIFLGCDVGRKDETIPYRQEDHGTFDEEFGPHEGVNGWWFMNGNLIEEGNPDKRYTFYWSQYNFRDYLGLGLKFYQVHLTLVDIDTGEVFFEQYNKRINAGAYATGSEVFFKDYSHLTKDENGFDLWVNMPKNQISYEFHFDYGKGAVWHGDNGVFTMGVPEDLNARTVYYSYTRMPTTGQITLTGESGDLKTLKVTGESWLERQWGTYMELAKMKEWTYQWLSVRFFDGEEIMLFDWPQNGYSDGTYVHADSSSERILDFTYKPTEFFRSEGACFGLKWDLTLPGIKDEHYRIEPLIEGGYTQGGFAEMASVIIDDEDNIVGYAFAECLPFLYRKECR